MPELHQRSAVELARAIASGETSSEAVVRSCLDRIARREPEIRAWAHLDPEAALAEARARDREAPRGVLHGVPVGFKDVIDTADMPTAYGSPIYPGHRPAADAACVALVRAAGGVVLGKTVTTEFAFVSPGRTRNPHDPRHTPGGSSSGSAAAVADAMVPLAFGTQTGGSVIRPAAFCGAVGYKPTLGRFSYAGVKLLARSLDTLGAFARRVADLALLRNALLGAPATVAPMAAAPRLGLCRTPWWERAEPSSRAAVEAAAARAAEAGAEVREINLPAVFADLPETNHLIMVHEGRRSLADEFNRHRERLSRGLRQQMEPGLEIPFADYRRALGHAAACRAAFDGLMADLDALIVPSAPGEAPVGIESTGDPLFNRAWTTIGAPCVTLPGHRGPKGLPVGVQLVASPDEDERLLGAALWMEHVMSDETA